METKSTIAKLNDEFRRRSGGEILLTPGVKALDVGPGLIDAIRAFDDFNVDNNPHGEHDFGSLQWDGQEIFWKIDYYDKDCRYWCDPLSPKCNRVITIMLAIEY